MNKTFPDHTLENALRDKGIPYRCMWEMKGPKDTHIAWLVAYLVESRVIIVQTFKDFGWQVFLPSEKGRIDETVQEVIDHCTKKDRAA